MLCLALHVLLLPASLVLCQRCCSWVRRLLLVGAAFFVEMGSCFFGPFVLIGGGPLRAPKGRLRVGMSCLNCCNDAALGAQGDGAFGWWCEVCSPTPCPNLDEIGVTLVSLLRVAFNQIECIEGGLLHVLCRLAFHVVFPSADVETLRFLALILAPSLCPESLSKRCNMYP